jgi:hypothetical protein
MALKTLKPFKPEPDSKLLKKQFSCLNYWPMRYIEEYDSVVRLAPANRTLGAMGTTPANVRKNGSQLGLPFDSFASV